MNRKNLALIIITIIILSFVPLIFLFQPQGGVSGEGDNDTKAPTVEITSPLNIYYYDNATQLIQINATDNDSEIDTIWYSWNQVVFITFLLIGVMERMIQL